MRVLLVEDDPRVGEPVQEAPQGEGYAVDWVRTGEEALGLVSAFPYDLAILDVMLPGMDGFALPRRLRGDRGRSWRFAPRWRGGAG
ncbi:response regulator [Thermus hydrothermalis]|uniref:response regulator n=1 Tax=Thermus hydrothermalis TaxID=2908148 RepID=UPI001FAB1C81